jgi:hypothetical protein
MTYIPHDFLPKWRGGRYEVGDGDGAVAWSMSFLPYSCGTPAVHHESKANHLGK